MTFLKLNSIRRAAILKKIMGKRTKRFVISKFDFGGRIFRTKFLVAINLVEFVREKMPFFEKPEDKMSKYWEQLTRQEIIERADKFFEEQRYMEVYESLNRMKYSTDIELIWRLARTLYNLSLAPDIEQDVRRRMIEEAYEILDKTVNIGRGQANYHKWMAVISDAKNGMESLDSRIRGYPEIRDHLKIACDKNPKDFTVQYMLGRWHYEMVNLTWFQRKVAKYLFLEPPSSSFQEAYQHLKKAEDVSPRTYLPNMYLLGRVCLGLGQYYRAKYYLNMALNLPPHGECEKCCVVSARSLLSKLEKYDLGKDLLYENYQFGFEG